MYSILWTFNLPYFRFTEYKNTEFYNIEAWMQNYDIHLVRVVGIRTLDLSTLQSWVDYLLDVLE